MAWDCGVSNWGVHGRSPEMVTCASRRCYCQDKVPYNSEEGMRMCIVVGKKQRADFHALICGWIASCESWKHPSSTVEVPQ